MKKLTLQEYKNNMEEKYKTRIDFIGSKLISVDSWSCGRLLYELLEESSFCPNELKYYIFANWWTSIDSYHDKFNKEHIKEWIKVANIDMWGEITSKLNIDNEGYVKVYRGTHECNQSWDGMSWTTDIEVAKKFANGCGVRHQTKNPSILEGRVFAEEHILGIFNGREESEVLCYVVAIQDGVQKLGA